MLGMTFSKNHWYLWGKCWLRTGGCEEKFLGTRQTQGSKSCDGSSNWVCLFAVCLKIHGKWGCVHSWSGCDIFQEWHFVCFCLKYSLGVLIFSEERLLLKIVQMRTVFVWRKINHFSYCLSGNFESFCIIFILDNHFIPIIGANNSVFSVRLQRNAANPHYFTTPTYIFCFSTWVSSSIC